MSAHIIDLHARLQGIRYQASGIGQAFTSYNNPKGNADNERFMRTLKEQLVWINEWQSPTKFFQALDAWIEYYNSSYLHSALAYQSPQQFEALKQIKNTQSSLLKNARQNGGTTQNCY